MGSEAGLNQFVKENSRRHLVLRFDDIEKPIVGQKEVTSQHIDQAIAFAKDAERLLVTCRAGQSRSVALAYVLSCQSFGSTLAMGMLNAKRHIPNQLLIREAARILGDPEMENCFQKWRTAHAHLKLSDYYDEINDEVSAFEQTGIVNQISIE
ncbi:hypothetical protein C5Y96_00600 [Blastopirellula marina]|uniref:Tyrosine specific protein phosphatases domain-containing protein n=1 Tax=Blastopirellula marina TaxID=124 RepID=A0A2S8G9Z0_9BACT|nr:MULTISPECIES: dual specificity protein phosphatase family protein [Pirellulaceae]PQO41247.1 hypothetical protein C5Y96_00600 [Blastopirellula marina]RCS56271.1 hypothetical protein DTL36_00600 [Bremerella cremea]